MLRNSGISEVKSRNTTCAKAQVWSALIESGDIFDWSKANGYVIFGDIKQYYTANHLLVKNCTKLIWVLS